MAAVGNLRLLSASLVVVACACSGAANSVGHNSDGGDDATSSSGSGSGSGSSSGGTTSSSSGTTSSSSGGSSSSGSGSGSSSGSSSSSGASSSSSGGGSCGACTTDQECVQSCAPAPSGQSNCCNTGLGSCYVAAQPTCPVSSSSSSGASSSGSGSSSSSGGGTCGGCTSDIECQLFCPPVTGGGSNCCDTNSHICYATTQATCPVPVDAGPG